MQIIRYIEQSASNRPTLFRPTTLCFAPQTKESHLSFRLGYIDSISACFHSRLCPAGVSEESIHTIPQTVSIQRKIRHQRSISSLSTLTQYSFTIPARCSHLRLSRNGRRLHVLPTTSPSDNGWDNVVESKLSSSLGKLYQGCIRYGRHRPA